MSDVTNTYAPQFKGWLKQYGSKPTADMLITAHAFGRPGKQSLALAMAMRPEGVTAGQVQMACGAPQNNHRRGLVTEGLFKRDMTVPQTEAGHTVYKITLTSKGEAAMKRLSAAQAKAAVDGDKPAKAKKAKVRKPKVLGDAAMANTMAMLEGDAAISEAPVSEPAGEQATA